MIIGIPRERKEGECRVAITPDGVQLLSLRKHQILIEKNAGILSGFTDSEYSAAGAVIIDSLGEVWAKAELLVKVKEPAPEEFAFFRKGLAVFSFLHPAVAPEMVAEMLKSGVIGIDYDLVTLDNGRLPILEPMSIIAGKLSIQCGAQSLLSGNGGRGILLGGAPGVKPGKVVVIGAGAAGNSAAHVALGMGALVTVFDINTEKLLPFTHGYYKATTLYSSPSAIRREIKNADLVIGSVLVPGALAPKLITRDMLGLMRAGSVIVDICIDQGGCTETSRPTSISQPTYTESGIVHYCVPNMPALVPRTSTIALTNGTLPWISIIADRGVNKALSSSMPLKRSLISIDGHLTNDIVGAALGLTAITEKDVNELISR